MCSIVNAEALACLGGKEGGGGCFHWIHWCLQVRMHGWMVSRLSTKFCISHIHPFRQIN